MFGLLLFTARKKADVYEAMELSSQAYEPLVGTQMKFVDQAVKNTINQTALTPAKLRELVRLHNSIAMAGNQDPIDMFLSKLPESYRRHYTFVHRSYSLQKGTPTSPRTILFGPDAQVVITFNAGVENNQLMQGGDSLEVMEWNQEKFIWEFSEIRFGSDGRATHEENPARCVMCHSGTPKTVEIKNAGAYQNYLKPIFPQYPFWPGFYGSVNDIVGVQGSRDTIMNKFEDTMAQIRGLTFGDTEELFRLKRLLDDNPKYTEVIKNEHDVHARHFHEFIRGMKTRNRYRWLISLTDLYESKGEAVPEHLKSAPYRRTFDKEYGHYLLRPNFYLSSLLAFYHAQYIAKQIEAFPLYDKIKFSLLARKYNCGDSSVNVLDPSFDLVYPNLKDQETRDRQYLLAYQFNVVRSVSGGPAHLPLHAWNMEANEEIASYHYGNVFSDLNELVLWRLLTDAFKDIKFDSGRHAAEERHYELPNIQYQGDFLERAGGYVSNFSSSQMKQAMQALSYNSSDLKFKAQPYSKYCKTHILPAAKKELAALKGTLPHDEYALDKRLNINTTRQACESCHTAQIPPLINVDWYSKSYFQTVKPLHDKIAQALDESTLPVPFGNHMPFGRRPMDPLSLECEILIVENLTRYKGPSGDEKPLRGLKAFLCLDPKADSPECRCLNLYRLKESLYKEFHGG